MYDVTQWKTYNYPEWCTYLMPNQAIIQSAFKAVRRLQVIYGDEIPWREITKGFEHTGEKIFLASAANGIFKPKRMAVGLLSIKTTVPKHDAIARYDDGQLGKGVYKYAFENAANGNDRNHYLFHAYHTKSPFIYFHGVVPGVYQAIWPCFIHKINEDNRYVEVVVGSTNAIYESGVQYTVPSEIEAKYYAVEAKRRGHQAAFSRVIMSAYKEKCALTKLSVRQLLEAAHIIPDSENGPQTVNNGIAMSRIHHKAYDSNLLGIDGDYKIHIRDDERIISGGHFAEVCFSELAGKKIWLPRDESSRPSPDFLDRRFQEFKRG